MASTSFLGALNLTTLVIVAVVVAIGFAFFLRRRSNRHPLENREERNIARDLDQGRPAEDHSPPK